MLFIADLHIHSFYSRATSKQLNLEHLNKWAQLKGAQVVATGDFCHPRWLDELQEKLLPAEEGLFQLKNEFARSTQNSVPGSCAAPVRFILSTEISNIYKKNGRVRKNHNILLVPSFESAKKIQERLGRIGNIASDGRPILGLDARDLLEIVLEADPLACLIPAHIWTPWFSVLGSNSGFDSIAECFEDLTPQIFAVETGLSSDPPMNWRLSMLDKYTLVSNSDAHSPEKLAREANIFNCDRSYPAMLNALRTGDPSLFGGTIEFFPEEGKYHLDGHRKCGVRLSPEETIANKEICPVCGKKLTLGVSFRVESLADRKIGARRQRALSYESLVTLPEILAEVYQVGPATKTVNKQMDLLLAKLGNELSILRVQALSDIEKTGGSLLAEGIRRARSGQVQISAGYDGEFGTVHLFTDQERDQLNSQAGLFLFDNPSEADVSAKKPTALTLKDAAAAGPTIESDVFGNLSPGSEGLNAQQLSAVRTVAGNLIIVAGPGTGKTQTLTHRIAYLVREQGVDPAHILAVTFTNKAAEEMANRLAGLLTPALTASLTIKTFHSFGAGILRAECALINYKADFTIINETDRWTLLNRLAQHLDRPNIFEISQQISAAKNQLLTASMIHEHPELREIYHFYQEALRSYQAFDFDDLVFQSVTLLQAYPSILEKYRQRYRWISVDEYQDINYAQYQLLKLLVTSETNLCVIGDPDQAIYGFRGADSRYFLHFVEDFAPAQAIYLERNYRSSDNILNASGQVIEKNPDHRKLKLWSDIRNESKLEIYHMPTEKAEAETIVHRIEKLVGATSFFSVDSGRAGYDTADTFSFGDIAILYRLNAQLPALEQALSRAGLPYQTYGETPFWERAEVREIISYLQVLVNPYSEIDLLRIINAPPRGIGEQSIQALREFQTAAQSSLWQAILSADEMMTLKDSVRLELKKLVQMIADSVALLGKIELAELIRHLIQTSGLAAYYAREEQRLDAWAKIIAQARERRLDLPHFLEHVVLQRETDYYHAGAERITLMTLHASKGLEFPVVFITGCEDSILPYLLNDKSDNQVEEERRLFYVGMTRAKQKLILIHASRRFLFGIQRQDHPSRFLIDIEEALKEQRQAQIPKKPKSDARPLDSHQLTLF